MINRYRLYNQEAIYEDQAGIGIELDFRGTWVRYEDIKHLLNVPEGQSEERAESYPQLSDVREYADGMIQVIYQFKNKEDYEKYFKEHFR